MSAILLATAALTTYVLSLLFLFKANAGVMFLAACAGLVLLSSIDPVVITTAGAIVPSEGEAYVRLLIVLLSVLFAAMMFSNSVHGNKLILHGLIGVLLAATLILILPETTGVSWLLNIVNEDYWKDANEFRSLVVAGGFGLSLVAVLVTSNKPHKKSKH